MLDLSDPRAESAPWRFSARWTCSVCESAFGGLRGCAWAAMSAATALLMARKHQLLHAASLMGMTRNASGLHLPALRICSAWAPVQSAQKLHAGR